MLKYRMKQESEMITNTKSEKCEDDVNIKQGQKVKWNNNVIWLYDDISDQSLYKLKIALQSINQMFDAWYISFPNIDISPVIHLRIASNGGCAFSGMHMYDVIKNNKYPVYTYVDGFCASAASDAFLGGTKRYMSENSFILIHQLSVWFAGTFTNLKDQYLSMQTVMNKAKKIYLDELIVSQQKLDELLSHDLWLSKEQAQQLGFCKY